MPMGAQALQGDLGGGSAQGQLEGCCQSGRQGVPLGDFPIRWSRRQLLSKIVIANCQEELQGAPVGDDDLGEQLPLDQLVSIPVEGPGFDYDYDYDYDYDDGGGGGGGGSGSAGGDSGHDGGHDGGNGGSFEMDREELCLFQEEGWTQGQGEHLGGQWGANEWESTCGVVCSTTSARASHSQNYGRMDVYGVEKDGDEADDSLYGPGDADGTATGNNSCEAEV